VVDAVRCALDVQRIIRARNALLPQDRRIEFRIGVNLGDVIVAPDDIYGHGVNVASRLEGLGRPAASASRLTPGAMCGVRSPPSSSISARSG
jgi:class 3 adenylate cyclase